LPVVISVCVLILCCLACLIVWCCISTTRNTRKIPQKNVKNNFNNNIHNGQNYEENRQLVSKNNNYSDQRNIQYNNNIRNGNDMEEGLPITDEGIQERSLDLEVNEGQPPPQGFTNM